MALKTAPVKISWRQGLLLQRQTTLQQAIMNCLTALSGHAANARCSTVAPRRREGHGHTYLQPNTRACAYGRRLLRTRSSRNCFGAAFSAPAKKNFDTPEIDSTSLVESFQSLPFSSFTAVDQSSYSAHSNPQGRLQQMNFEGAEYKLTFFRDPLFCPFLHHPSRLRCCLCFLDSVYAAAAVDIPLARALHMEGSRSHHHACALLHALLWGGNAHRGEDWRGDRPFAPPPPPPPPPLFHRP